MRAASETCSGVHAAAAVIICRSTPFRRDPILYYSILTFVSYSRFGSMARYSVP